MKQNNYDISRYDDEYFFSIIYVIIMVWEYIFDGVCLQKGEELKLL